MLFDNGATQTYHYTADGEKWRTVYMAGMLLKDTVDYCGGAIVENGVLKKLLTPVGYVDMSGSTPSYYYYLKDHQGNNRVVINSSGTVQETNHYYPFGGLFAANGSVQNYKYNGKEWDDKTKWYDYGARHYDATLGRFTTQDRFAEKYSALSTYQYGANNPICNVDINGDSINVASITHYDKIKGSDYLSTLISDLQSQTGLKLSVKGGKLVYEKDNNGNALIAIDGDEEITIGSETARSHLIGLIDNVQTINVGIATNKGSKGKGENIWLDPNQISSFVSGAMNIDNRTMGWGMVFLHESYHTTIGGNYSDAPYNPGPVVNVMNIIREELNLKGGNYGIRQEYLAYLIRNNRYIPFNKAARGQIIELGLPPLK